MPSRWVHRLRISNRELKEGRVAELLESGLLVAGISNRELKG